MGTYIWNAYCPATGTFVRVTTSSSTPPTGTSQGDAIDAGSLGLTYSDVDQSITNLQIPSGGSIDVSGGTLTIPSDTVLPAAVDGKLFYKTDNQSLYVGTADAMRKVGSIDYVLTVAPSGADYTSIKEAAEAASGLIDVTPDSTYLVQIAPGSYYEDPFVLGTGVYLEGLGDDASIYPNNLDAHFITIKTGSSIKGCYIDGPTGTGFAAVYYNDTTPGITWIYNGGFYGGYYGVLAEPAITTGILIVENVELYATTNPMNALFSVKDGASVLFHGMDIGGPSGYLEKGFEVVDGGVITLLSTEYDMDGSKAFYVNNGGKLNAQGVIISHAAYGLYVDGVGTSVVSMGQVAINNDVVQHIKSVSSLSAIGFRGGAARSKIDVNGSAFSGNFTDTATTENVNVGEMQVGNIDDGFFPASLLLRTTANTGLISGGAIVKGTGLNVAVSGGSGFIRYIALSSEPTIKYVTWSGNPAFTLNANKTLNYIYVDNDGAIQQSDAEPDYNDSIILGAAHTGASSVELLTTHNVEMVQQNVALHEFIENTLGTLSKSGGTTTHSGLGLGFDGGSFYVGLTQLTSAPASAPATFTYWHRSGGGWTPVTGQTAVDVTYYDATTGLDVMPSGYYRKDASYIVVNGGATEFHVVYGQETFADSTLATNGNLPTPPSFVSYASLRSGGVIVEKAATGIFEVLDIRPRVGAAASSSAGVTNHADLSGLSADDHAQYQLRSEKNTVNGYAGLSASGRIPLSAVALHASTHAPAGVDQLNIDSLGTSATGANLFLKTNGAGGAEFAQVNHTTLSNIGTTTHANIDAHIGASSAVHGITGAVVGTTDSQQLSAKTLILPTIAATGWTNANHDHLAAGGGGVLTSAAVALGSVTNDAQLKRSANDFNTFTLKGTPATGDFLLVEDSAASGVKKYVTIGSLPGGLSSHVLATNTGLGAFHTMSGAAAGQVLRASSATGANFQQLAHSEVSGIGANDHHNQAHAATGADHTVSGSTSGQFLRINSGASALQYQAITFTKTVNIVNPVTGNITIWRVPQACTIAASGVWAHTENGSGITFNLNRVGTSNVFSSNQTINATGWTSFNPSSGTMSAGRELEIAIIGVTGAVTEFALQVDYTYDP